jgi:DNA-binding XRE family transcriptional regulator
MAEYQEVRERIEVSVGESVRIIRELQELSQNRLAASTGIPQSTISAIERDRVKLGAERAVVDRAKGRDFLLSDTHSVVGRWTAQVVRAPGLRPDDPEPQASELLHFVRDGELE